MQSIFLISLFVLGAAFSCGDQSSKQNNDSTVSDVVIPPTSLRYQCRNEAGNLCKQEIIRTTFSKDKSPKSKDLWGKNSCKVYKDLAACFYDCQADQFGKDRGNRCVQIPPTVPVYKKKPTIN